MSEATPAHNRLLPRLLALVGDAGQAGFDRAAVVAVITDLIAMPPFNDTGTPSDDDA